MQMKQITKVFFLNFTFCYQFQFQGDLYVSITKNHYTPFNPWASKLKENSYNDIFLYNYISVCHSLWNRSDLFPTSLLSLHFNKRKNHWEIRPWKHSLNMSSNLPRIQKRNKLKTNRRNKLICLKWDFCMYEYVCVCVSGGLSA